MDTDSLPDYEFLDQLLDAYVAGDRSAADLVAEGFDADLVERILRLTDLAEYKRRQYPPGTKISLRAFGRDRRLPITSRWRESARVAAATGPRSGLVGDAVLLGRLLAVVRDLLAHERIGRVLRRADGRSPFSGGVMSGSRKPTTSAAITTTPSEMYDVTCAALRKASYAPARSGSIDRGRHALRDRLVQDPVGRDDRLGGRLLRLVREARRAPCP